MPGIKIRVKPILGSPIRFSKAGPPNDRVLVSGPVSRTRMPARTFNFTARKRNK